MTHTQPKLIIQTKLLHTTTNSTPNDYLGIEPCCYFRRSWACVRRNMSLSILYIVDPPTSAVFTESEKGKSMWVMGID
jgi:hypothetical protein